MAQGNLSPLQSRLLAILAGMEPAWTLTGGGAIVGFHSPYRRTRDLDLFWRGLRELGELDTDVLERLRQAKLDTKIVKRTPTFVRFEVNAGDEICVVDLVADPGPTLTPALHCQVEGHEFLVDALPELLINKLVAMLSRYELRDLADTREILKQGIDLDRALSLAPQKDGGFSPIVLAWVLSSYPFKRYRSDDILPEAATDGLEEFRQWLTDLLAEKSDPGDKLFERP